jgi:hypothetical protein
MTYRMWHEETCSRFSSLPLLHHSHEGERLLLTRLNGGNQKKQAKRLIMVTCLDYLQHGAISDDCTFLSGLKHNTRGNMGIRMMVKTPNS